MPSSAAKRARIVGTARRIRMRRSSLQCAGMCGQVRLCAPLCGFCKNEAELRSNGGIIFTTGLVPLPWLPKPVDAVRPLMPGYARFRPRICGRGPKRRGSRVARRPKIELFQGAEGCFVPLRIALFRLVPLGGREGDEFPMTNAQGPILGAKKQLVRICSHLLAFARICSHCCGGAGRNCKTGVAFARAVGYRPPRCPECIGAAACAWCFCGQWWQTYGRVLARCCQAVMRS